MNTRGKRLLTAALCLCIGPALGLLCPGRAAAEQEIGKVLTTTSHTPVALMEAGTITAATSTGGCSITEYNWYDLNSGSAVTGQFGTGNVEVDITLAAAEGYVFSESVAVYLNNSQAAYVLSADRRYLSLSRTYAPDIWAPTVIKQPGSEKLNEGDSTSFVATASYTMDYKWHFVEPGTGRDYGSDAFSEETGVATSGDGSSKIVVYEVPARLDGWKVYCRFIGAGGYGTDSQAASISVKYETPPPTPEPTPTPEASPAAQEEDAPEASPASSAEPAATARPTAEPGHVHEFPERWSHDEARHWRECACGEKSESGAHSMVWTVERRPGRDRAGLETGVCSVCGYETSRETDPAGALGVLRYVLPGIGALVLLTLLVLIVDAIRADIRRKRRRRRRRSSGRTGRR